MAQGGTVGMPLTRSSDLPEEEASLSLRWIDEHAMVLISILKNPGGRYATVEIMPISTRGRSVWICVPAAINGSG